MGVFALAQGVLTIAGVIQLWHVDVLAFLSGCAAALDAPVRQTFVAEMVGDEDLHNAVALNSSSFTAAQLIGPAAAGLLIAGVGLGWAFVLNGVSFAAVLISMSFFRRSELRASARAHSAASGFKEGLRYVWKTTGPQGDPDHAVFDRHICVELPYLHFYDGRECVPLGCARVRAALFDHGRGHSLWSVACRRPPETGITVAVGGPVVFGIGCTLAALAPGYWGFAGALVIIGAAALTFGNATNSAMQLATEPSMRGRVMALRVAVALGGTPIGAPLLGWVANRFGPRWGLVVGAGHASRLRWWRLRLWRVKRKILDHARLGAPGVRCLA